MIKIWFKLTKDEKILKSKVFAMDSILSEQNFLEILHHACNEFDVPTPIVLKSHLFSYVNFNTTTFKPSDFVEPFDFDTLVLENAAD